MPLEDLYQIRHQASIEFCFDQLEELKSSLQIRLQVDGNMWQFLILECLEFFEVRMIAEFLQVVPILLLLPKFQKEL